MKTITVYKCGCTADGNNVSPHCPMHGMMGVEYVELEVAERLLAAAMDGLRGLYNGFEPDNQSATYYRLRAAIKQAEEE